MRIELSRTVAAFVLAAAAVALPCGSWFVVGSREAAREADRLEEGPRRLATNTARQLADRLAVRLEALRDNEEKRPFYHYQGLYHDPKGAYEGTSVVPSPLAQGPDDPLIEAHFQIDAAGKLSLPTLNDDVSQKDLQQELSPQQLDQQRAVREELQPAVVTCVALANEGQANAPAQIQFSASSTMQPNATKPTLTINGGLATAPPPEPAPQQLPAQWAEGQQSAQAGQQPAAQPPQQQKLMPRMSKTEVLDQAAWTQNAAAPELYNTLRSGKLSTKQQRTFEQLKASKDNVEIQVGPFQWATVPLAGRPMLAALRTVTTPDGRRVQGFLISAKAVADSLKGAAFPATFTQPGQEPAQRGRGWSGSDYELPNSTSAVVGDTGWQVLLDASSSLGTARTQAHNVRARFLQSFLAGSLATCFAAFCLVFIVWQTDRLARQRSQFAASAAHELRTPLAGLRMYAEMLAEGLGDPARAKDYAKRLATEAERLGRVVANVLGFTRIERGMLAVHPEPGDLAAAVRESVARQQGAVEAAGARVSLAIADDLPPIKFDRDAIAQIVQNLLDNAEKHTRHATDRTIGVAVAATNGVATLTVTDRGSGVPAEVRQRLFKPFERGNHPDAPAGLGLGLVLVQALVRAHGGKVEYADHDGGGARFTVTLPG